MVVFAVLLLGGCTVAINGGPGGGDTRRSSPLENPELIQILKTHEQKIQQRDQALKQAINDVSALKKQEKERAAERKAATIKETMKKMDGKH